MNDAQIAITLPDGTVRRFDRGVTGAEVARAIGPGLAKAAIAMTIDGEAKDLARHLDHDAKVSILTREAPQSLEIIRHDAAHVMAEAVKELYPEMNRRRSALDRYRLLMICARHVLHARRPDAHRNLHARDRRPRRADRARGT